MENTDNIDNIPPIEKIIDDGSDLLKQMEEEKVLLDEKEKARLKRNEYHRNYYSKNKFRYNKHCGEGAYRGDRGRNQKMRYKLSILNIQTGKPILSKTFRSLVEMSEHIDVPKYTLSLIYRGHYKLGNNKSKKTSKYNQYLIEKI
jgi:hypothetical protein